LLAEFDAEHPEKISGRDAVRAADVEDTARELVAPC
jgi:hypothetical protein